MISRTSFYGILSILLCIGICLPGVAQDAVFSQFYASPLTLNPALTGSFNGTYRITANYRDQWRGVANNPYQTFAVSGEIQLQWNERNTGNSDLFGAGLLFYSDRVGAFDLNTTQIAVSASYHKSLSKHNNSYLGAGMQVGIVQRNINYENLFFGDQFDGLDSYSLSTAENLPPNNFGFGDLALGLNYAISPTKKTRIFAGVAMHHVSAPNISFYQKTTVINPTFETENKLHRRLSAHASASFGLSEIWTLSPRLFYSKQGSHQATSIGSHFRYAFLESDGRALHFGTWLRLADGVDSFGVDAAILMFGVELNGLILGLSYDANLDDLLNERAGQGTFELSINFVGQHEDDSYICPEF